MDHGLFARGGRGISRALVSVMISVSNATPEVFDQVYPLLEHFNQGNDRLSKDHWRNLFHYPWQFRGNTRGFLLLDGDKAVGIELLIQCDRVIDGQIHRVAHGSSWYVRPEYRSSSLLLKTPLYDLMDEGLSITNFTPKPEFESYHKLTGASVLETHQIILLPIPDPILISGLWRWSASGSPQKFLHLLNSNDRQIYEDHSTLPCKHLVVWSGDKYCYLVHSKTEGPRGFPSSFVHYISNFSVFMQAIEKIKLALQFSNRAPFVTIERRMLRGHTFRFSREVPLKNPRLFWSKTLKAEQIDSLYSEMILLEL